MRKVTFRRSKAFWAILLVFVFCLTVILIAGPVQALPALLWLKPADPVASVGGTVDVDLQLDDVSGVFGAQMELSFDPAILQVAGELLTPGTCPTDDWVLDNTDNSLGIIDYSSSNINPTASCDGGGGGYYHF